MIIEVVVGDFRGAVWPLTLGVLVKSRQERVVERVALQLALVVIDTASNVVAHCKSIVAARATLSPAKRKKVSKMRRKWVGWEMLGTEGRAPPLSNGQVSKKTSIDSMTMAMK